jgi:4a-hydroxytetrahydrobiopterin dehydratase
MTPTNLGKEQISEQIRQLNGWSMDGKEIGMLDELTDFVRAMTFVNSVALLAEKHNHHPDIDIRWNKVHLALSMRSAGGLTEVNFKLAKAVDEL